MCKQKHMPPAPLFWYHFWNLGYNFCGISTGSPNSPIWNLGYNFLGISTSSPNSLLWSLGYMCCSIKLFSLYPQSPTPLPIMGLHAVQCLATLSTSFPQGGSHSLHCHGILAHRKNNYVGAPQKLSCWPIAKPRVLGASQKYTCGVGI